MSFYIVLVLVNVACFVPLYALNFRERPNPFEALLDKKSLKAKLRLLGSKQMFTDPFRINFDFTFLMLLAAAANYSATWLVPLCSVVLTFGFVEILYTSIMAAVFKRPPAIVSDISLIKAGLLIVQRQSYWILPAVIGLLAAIAFASYEATALLFLLMPQPALLPLIFAALLLPPCLYGWRTEWYANFFPSRTVYSPTLHFYRNLRFSVRLKAILAKDEDHFDRRNYFKGVTLSDSPSIITICVESYGSVVYRDAQYHTCLQDLLGEYESRLSELGYRFASNHSEAPIFAGGSWLSYTSFTYGSRLDDCQVFDGLFSYDNGFGAYESLFHVLRRNGYRSALLCPLGGPDAYSVDWTTINRCFQSDRNIEFKNLDYRGERLSFLGGNSSRYTPPDQYSLNFAYETVRKECAGPFSLFFCTLNSHFPWNSPAEAVADWRTVNDPNVQPASRARDGTTAERYRDAIRYQLDYIFRFVVDHADDDLLVVVFGDHQPPIITSERMGRQTPVHVIGRNGTLMKVLHDHGFVPAINLTGVEPPPIRHEGFLSLFLKAMHAAYGKTPDLRIDYRERGVTLLDELQLHDTGKSQATN